MTGVCFQYSKLGTCSYGSTCRFQHIQPLPTTANVNAEDESTSEDDDENNNSPLERFFAKYSRPGFRYNPEQPVINQFNLLCRVLGLDPNDPNEKRRRRVKEIRDGLKDAMVLQFNGIYGTDENSAISWQSLCRVLGFLPVPTTLDECKRLVTNTHVNLVDLVDSGGTQAVTKFPSEKALSTYTLETRKIFPRQNVHAGGLLEALLRHIYHPPDERKQQGLRRKGHRKRSKGSRGVKHKVLLKVGTIEPATHRRHTTIRRKAFLVAKSRLEKT